MTTKKIRIVNWLLTRRCNMKCKMCLISSNRGVLPKEYPPLSYYYKNEIELVYIIECLIRLKAHNPDIFHVFYGGEPLLWDDLSGLVNFCNKNNIYYTIITNNTWGIQKRMKQLLQDVDYISGLTYSINPSIYKLSFWSMNEKGAKAKGVRDDSSRKGLEGFYASMLRKSKGAVSNIRDRCVEVTISNDDKQFLFRLMKRIAVLNLIAIINFVDVRKSIYYDFSNVEDSNLLVKPTEKLCNSLKVLVKEFGKNIHMGNTLLSQTVDILPSNFDCRIEKRGISTLTVDCDGSVRLCLRIRGVKTPKSKLLSYISLNGSINDALIENMIYDKVSYCERCNWTCPIMSQIIDDNDKNLKALLHS